MFKIFLLITFFGSISALAQSGQDAILLPEITLESTSESPASENKAVIEKSEIELRQLPTVAEALKTVEGLHVVTSGGLGQVTSIFLRGSNSDHVLVLIDGVEFNDFLSPTRAANIDAFTSDEIERVEVLRGPQTLRYGPAALSGVINIITKKGLGAPQRLVKTELGKYDSVNGIVGISGGEPDSNYDIRYNQLQTSGFSVADSHLGNTEADGFLQSQISGRFGAEPVKNLGLDLSVRYIDSFAENDLNGGANQDDLDYHTDTRKLLASLKTFSESKSKFATLENTFAIQRIDRVSENLPDLHSAASTYENYHGQLLSLASTSTLNWKHSQKTQVGIDFEEDRGRSNQFTEKSNRFIGGFVSHIYQPVQGFFFDVGGRWDQQFYDVDEIVSDQNSESYLITQNGIGYAFSSFTQIRLGGGTSIKQPSLFQLYSAQGNPTLRTESGSGVDLSLEHSFANGFGRLSAAIFYDHFENLISFQGAQFINQGEAETYGAEFVARTPIGPGVLIGGTYTTLRTRDLATGLPLLRRPDDAATADLQLNLTKSFQILLSSNFVGVRDDIDAITTNRKVMPSYFVSRIASNYQIDNNSKIFARIENLFDRDYQEIDGYGTSGRAGYIGFSSQF